MEGFAEINLCPSYVYVNQLYSSPILSHLEITLRLDWRLEILFPFKSTNVCPS